MACVVAGGLEETNDQSLEPNEYQKKKKELCSMLLQWPQ